MCYGNILEASMRHARKAHRCTGCNRMIEPGRAYLRQVIVDGRSFETSNWCLRCHAKFVVVAHASGDSCVEDVNSCVDEMRNDAPKEWREALRYAMRSALAKLKPRRRAAGGGA